MCAVIVMYFPIVLPNVSIACASVKGITPSLPDSPALTSPVIGTPLPW